MRWYHYQRLVGVIVVAWAVLFTSFAQAQALPVYNGRVNAAVGGIVSSKVGKWGFAANDPRITATASGIGAGLTTLGVGLATGAVATVGWPVLLAAAGISAVVGGGVSLAVDGLYKWIFNADGTISTVGGSSTIEDPNGLWYPASDPTGKGCQMVNNIADMCVRAGGQAHSFSACWTGQNPTIACYQGKQNLTFAQAMQQAGYGIPTKPIDNDVKNAPASTAAAKIPVAELAKPMSNEMLAAAANAAWRAAATNAGGLPWSASDPITPADVAEWRAQNPSLAPTVGDMTAPVSNGGSVSVGPAATPGGSTTPVTGPVTTPGSGAQIDLGPNPNTAAPTMEATPTAAQILEPILKLMPDLKNFSVPGHTSACPKPSFSAFSKTYLIASHCDLIESSRSIIEAAMLLMWTISSVFIVLRA